MTIRSPRRDVGNSSIVGKATATGPSGCELPRISIPYVNRLLGRGEAQGAPSEIVEMGDLSRRERKPDSARVGLF